MIRRMYVPFPRCREACTNVPMWYSMRATAASPALGSRDPRLSFRGRTWGSAWARPLVLVSVRVVRALVVLHVIWHLHLSGEGEVVRTVVVLVRDYVVVVDVVVLEPRGVGGVDADVAGLL